MKKLFVTILLLLAATSYASQKAITDTGEEVILNSEAHGNILTVRRRLQTWLKQIKQNLKSQETPHFY